ncbi:hypothetical protein C8R46DRAFT_1235653 [Mycena filopes]|nr:hypothetical protein C8R46DRAFT_1235653 [Mycena filopes]
MQSPRSRRFSGFVQRTLDNARGRRSSTARRSRPVSASLLPPELWLKIFGYIPVFLLPSVTLTSRTFRALAQPLLFTTISTHPDGAPSSAKFRRRVVDRIDFFFSPHIAPTVRHCKIALTAPEDDGFPADDIIDFIFHTLPRLPNLQSLECRHLRLTPERLAVLQHLQLTTISLELCFGDITEFAIACEVPMRNVTFKYPDASRDGIKASPCPIFLSPNHLEHLHATTTEVLPALARSQCFERLTTLALPVECLSSVDLLPALLRCPAVEELTLHTSTLLVPNTLFEALPLDILPRLNFYRGPHHFAPALLAGRTVPVRVDVTVPARPHTLLASLLNLPRSLTALAFSLRTPELPPALLQAVHATFPHLAALAVRAPALTSADIRGLLASLPAPHTGLRDLTLRVQGRDRFNLWIPPDESAADAAVSFGKVRGALLHAYPGLRRVRFMHGMEGASAVFVREGGSAVFYSVE